MTIKYHAAVFIGRFQPFHLGHEAIVREGLKQADEVIIVVGSSFAARNVRNPFTFEERKAMIKSVFPENNVKVVPVSDYPYNDNKWVAAVQSAVMSNIKFIADPLRIALIGHKKDETSYYLNIFKHWKSIAVKNVDGINATDIRNAYLDGWSWNAQNNPHIAKLSATVASWLEVNSQKFETTRAEYQMVKAYRKQWATVKEGGTLPFPVQFQTVDAVVTHSGKVLLVKRGDNPGKGLWALPGGFLNPNERMLDGALRELKEETKIKVSERTLRDKVGKHEVFDHPNRSTRGRTITNAYHIDFGYPAEEPPKVKGSDDAVEAKWVLYGDIRQEDLFEDHWHIIDFFTNIG